MKMAIWMLILTVLWVLPFAGSCFAQSSTLFSADKPSFLFFQPEKINSDTSSDRMAATVISQPTPAKDPSEESELEDSEDSIPDPLKPWNRGVFYFNDKFYFWILKPVAQGYRFVIPEEFRVCFHNFFSNLVMPVRFVNCALQGKFKAAGNEVIRFGVNTTVGFFGFFDQAKDKFGIDQQDEDFGQTLGFWGIGPVFYIEWPLLGPASLRDSVGFVGDFFLDPRTYLSSRPIVYIIRPFEAVNETSLRIGEYEDLKKAAIDPYVAKRNAYHQYRKNKIRN